VVNCAEVSSFLAALRDVVRPDITECELQQSFDPLQNFIDWLDEPDKVVETEGHTIYVWSPVRLSSKEDILELAVVDFGPSRGIYLGHADSPVDPQSLVLTSLPSFNPCRKSL